MKYFFPVLMGTVILAGLILALSPIFAGFFGVQPEYRVREAQSSEIAHALRGWFLSPNAQIQDAQGIQQIIDDHRVAAYTFSVGRKPVETFIRSRKLKQLEITETTYAKTFYQDRIEASWWQPNSSGTETYFSGQHENRELNLIYNANSKRGLLVVKEVSQ